MAGAIVAEVSATLSLKAALASPGFYAVVVVGYLCAFACLSLCLRRGLPLGTAYGTWSACGVTLTALASALIFAEPITPVMWLGIACVAVGVFVVQAGEHRAGRAVAVASGADAGFGAGHVAGGAAGDRGTEGPTAARDGAGRVGEASGLVDREPRGREVGRS